MKFKKISSDFHFEKLASTCALLDLAPYTLLHPPARSWLVASSSNTYSIPGCNFQSRIKLLLWPLESPNLQLSDYGRGCTVAAQPERR